MRILIGLLLVVSLQSNAKEIIKVESVDSVTNNLNLYNVLRLETANRQNDKETFQEWTAIVFLEFNRFS